MGRRTITHLADANGVSTGQISVFDTRTLFDAQVEALARLGYQFDGIIAAGRTIGANNYQIDDLSRANMLMSYNSPPSTWITSDNQIITLNAAQFQAGCQNVNTYYNAMIANRRTHKNAIAAIKDIPSCDIYDVSTGWPP